MQNVTLFGGDISNTIFALFLLLKIRTIRYKIALQFFLKNDIFGLTARCRSESNNNKGNRDFAA